MESERVSANIIYNSVVKNDKTSENLLQLVNLAEDFNTKKSDYDVIKEYLLLSGNCQELMQLIKDLSMADAIEADLRLKVLCHILIRLASDLNMYISAGTALVNAVLSHGMKTVFNFLKFKQKSYRTKLALHLLSSMVALGDQIAFKVVTKLDFSNTNFVHLLNRTNISEEEDIRTAFLNFIVLIFTMCNDDVVRQIVEVKGFLNAILPTLIYDRPSTIVLMLSTFRRKILENSSIPKTVKLRLFNDHSLSTFPQLYVWIGPMKSKRRKRKLGDDDDANPLAFEVTDEEAEDVHKSVHEFMMALCCSHECGIIFQDSSFGFSGRNMNPVITNILKGFLRPYSDPKMSEFVMSVLRACPDQLKFYVPLVKDSFLPRLSTSWLDMINFFKKMLQLQDPTVMFYSENKKPIFTLLNMASTFCLLDVINASEINDVFVHGHHVLCYYLSDFLLSILNQVQRILVFSVDQKSSKILYESSDVAAFQQSFRSLVYQKLPIMGELQTCWGKITSRKAEVPFNNTVQEDIPLPSLSEELILLLKLMKMFQNLNCNSSCDFELNYSTIFSNLKKCCSTLSCEELSSIYITAVDLLATQDSSVFWNKNATESALMIVGDMYLNSSKLDLSNAVVVIYKILLQTKVFDNCEWEIEAWVDALKYTKTKHVPHVFAFINEAMHSLLYQKHKFLVDVQSSVHKSKNVSISSNVLNGILTNDEMDVEQTSLCVGSHQLIEQQQCFSSFVPAVLHTLQSSEGGIKKGCQVFVEKALVLIMHHQYSPPHALFSVIQQYRSLLSPSLIEYFELLLSPKNEILITNSLNASGFDCTLDLSGHLQQNFICNHSSDVSMETCSCDIRTLLESLDHTSIRKVIWQVLTYLDFEVTLTMKKETEETTALNYINLLEQFTNCLLVNEGDFTEKNYVINVKQYNYIQLPLFLQKLEIVKEMVNHPIILKLFLGIPAKAFKYLQNCVVNVTKLVTNVSKNLMAMGNKNNYMSLLLCPFKDKVLEFLKSRGSIVNTEDFEVDAVIETFSSLFTINDIHTSLETILNAEINNSESFHVNLSSMCLLLQLFLEREEFVPLSSKIVNALISKYIIMPKKQKKIMKEYLVKLFKRHPMYSSFLTDDSAHLFIQHKSVKDLAILGLLIDSSDVFRYAVQTSTMESSEEIDSIVFIYLTSKCLINCKEENELDKNYKEVISSRLWTILTEFLREEINVEVDFLKESHAGKAAQMLVREKYISSKKLNKLCKLMLENPESVVPSFSTIHVLLQLFETWKLHKNEKDKTVTPILKITLNWLVGCVSADFCCWDLTDFIIELLQDMDGIKLDEILDVNAFFTKSLKTSFKYEIVGKEILKILYLLCEKSDSNNIPVQSIYNLVTGHSKFFQVMVMENVEKNSFKEHIIDLLTILVKRDGTVCKENHVGLYLSSYGASMNAVDQKVLYLIKLYADNGVNMNKYRPFLWGKPAIAHYSIMKDTQMHLWKQPKLQDVLNGFRFENIENTVLNFPLNTTLLPSHECCEMDENFAGKIYDYRFYLPQFANLFSPGSFVHLNSALESKVLMLIFSSLSSFDSDTRALGYYCLAQFYHHLEGAHYKEKGMWISLLDCIRNSINSVNPRIPSIITLFLARAADIFTRPDHSMYSILYKFIMIKPFLDITQVPEYYKLFNSADIEHRIQRLWLLSLIADGLKTSLDFHICEKRYIFSSLLTHYSSSISSDQEKVLILRVINSAVKIKSTARTLCQNGLLLWLHNIIEHSDSTNVDVIKNLCSIMQNLQVTAVDFIQEFTIVLISLLKKLSYADASSMKKYISTLLGSLMLSKNSTTATLLQPQLSLDDVSHLCIFWKEISENFRSKKDSIEASEVKNSLQLFAKAITFWQFSLDENIQKDIYDKRLTNFSNVLELLLLSFDSSMFYFHDLPNWLLECINGDQNQDFSKMFVTPKGKVCLKMIFKLFEKCLGIKDLASSSQSQVRNINSWKKLLLCFKDFQTSCHSTVSQLFKQVYDTIVC